MITSGYAKKALSELEVQEDRPRNLKALTQVQPQTDHLKWLNEFEGQSSLRKYYKRYGLSIFFVW